MYIFLAISYGTIWENLFKYQVILSLVISSLTVMIRFREGDQGRALISFLEKQPNVPNKTLILI